MDLRLQNLKENFIPLGIRAVFTDVDGTLTQKGRLASDVLAAFERLKKHGIRVVLTTGRSAGWVHALTTYLPVAGGMAENGGVFVSVHDETSLQILNSNCLAQPLEKSRAQFEAAFLEIKKAFPGVLVTGDNAFRLTDFTFSLAQQPQGILECASEVCKSRGLVFEYSSIHGHIMHQNQSKGRGVLNVIENIPDLQMNVDQLVTVGDSPNDQSLFDRAFFPYSVGVANVKKYASSMQHVPRFVTNANEGQGFIELSELLVSGSI